jgi:tetratricopeptide (TPR) repeat protein
MIIVVVALVCATMGVLLGKMFVPTADTALSGQLYSLEKTLDQIGSKLRTLEAAQEELSLRLQNARSGPVRISSEDIEPIVQRYLAAHAAGAAPVSPETSAAPAKGNAAAGADLNALVAELLDPQLPRNKRESIWAQLKDQGLLDEAIAQVEKKASAAPKDAEQHVALADLYLQKLFTVNDGPERGKWATLADQEFDRALEANPNHWNARFSKAISLSFWPPIFGKQEEAAKQFETLIGQQEQSGRRDPEHASSYLFLGNLYAQMGKADKAQETWRQGLVLFPDDAELKAKLGQ